MSEEIQRLNADDLDLEELERRMEMSAVLPLFVVGDSLPALCGTASCGTNSCGTF